MKYWRRLSGREKILGLLTCAAVLVVLLYNAGLQDVLARWESLKQEIEMKERLLAKNQGLIESAERINADYEALTKYTTAEANESAAASQVLRKIQSLARDEIVIENIKPLETKKHDLSRVYEFELEGSASKEILIRFLYKAATSEEALRIRALTASSTRSGNELRYYMVISKMQLL